MAEETYHIVCEVLDNISMQKSEKGWSGKVDDGNSGIVGGGDNIEHNWLEYKGFRRCGKEQMFRNDTTNETGLKE